MMLFSNFYLPIEIIKITNKEYKMQEKIYTEAELKAILIDKLKAELEEEIGDKTIANVNINTNQENRLCRSWSNIWSAREYWNRTRDKYLKEGW